MEMERLGDYEFIRTLGEGSFGKVKLARHTLTQHLVAVKILDWDKVKEKGMEKKVRREIKILKLFDHPHVIRLYEVVNTEQFVFMVMEVAEGVLLDFIMKRGRLGEAETRSFFQQIISGLEYCHENMVVHRDLKPENVLLGHGAQVKIADFGLSNIFKDGQPLETACGSPNYAAPEVIKGTGYSGPEVDIWSCGVMLYALLCGRLPFDEPNIPRLFDAIESGRYSRPTHLSAHVCHLIARMLEVNPAERIGIAEIRKHPWFVVDLPRYLSVPYSHRQQLLSTDPEVVTEAASITGRSEEEIVSSVAAGYNQVSVVYHLIATAKKKKQQKAGGRAAVAAAAGGGGGEFEPPSPKPALDDAEEERLRMERMNMGGTRQQWQMGLASFRSVERVIQALCDALKTMAFEWRFEQAHAVLFRRLDEGNAAKERAVGGPGVQEGGEEPKGEEGQVGGEEGGNNKQPKQLLVRAQVLRADQKFVLDFERVEGPVLEYLDVVSSVLMHLDV